MSVSLAESALKRARSELEGHRKKQASEEKKCADAEKAEASKQMKGRGVRTIDPADLRAVTGDATANLPESEPQRPTEAERVVAFHLLRARSLRVRLSRSLIRYIFIDECHRGVRPCSQRQRRSFHLPGDCRAGWAGRHASRLPLRSAHGHPASAGRRLTTISSSASTPSAKTSVGSPEMWSSKVSAGGDAAEAARGSRRAARRAWGRRGTPARSPR